jgi:hypothetical protein
MTEQNDTSLFPDGSDNDFDRGEPPDGPPEFYEIDTSVFTLLID